MVAKNIVVRGTHYKLVEARHPQDSWEEVQEAIMEVEANRNAGTLMKVKKALLHLQDDIGAVALKQPKNTGAVTAKKYIDDLITKVFPVEGAETKAAMKDVLQQAFKIYRYFDGVRVIDPSRQGEGENKAPQPMPAMGSTHLAAKADPEKVKKWNASTIKYGDLLLRTLTDTFNALAQHVNKYDPKTLTTTLSDVLSDASIKTMEDFAAELAGFIDNIKNSVENTSAYNKMYAPKRMENPEGKAPDIMHQWQKGASVIPPGMIRVRGVLYRYVGLPHVHTAGVRYGEALPKEMQDKILPYNRVQNAIIGNLQAALRDAWHKLRDNLVPKLPKGEDPGDMVIPLFDSTTISELTALQKALTTAVTAAKAWLAKLNTFRQKAKEVSEPIPLTKVKQPGRSVEVSIDALDEGSKRLVQLWMNNHPNLKPGTPAYKTKEQTYIQRALEMSKNESKKDLGKARLYASIPPRQLRFNGTLYRRSEADKKLIIMRGVSGSGKSTKAKSFGGEVFSTDEFFYNKGNYDFDPTQLSNAHAWNLMRATHAMHQGINPVVVDNTVVKAWEAKPYVEAAQKYGYDVEIVEPESPWWKSFHPGMSEEELWALAETMAKKNTHGVPAQGIFRMLSNWEPNITVEDILRSSRPF